DGVQLKAPVEPLIVAPAGAPASSEKVRVLAGTSASVAVAVKATSTPTVPALSPIAARTGATLTSFTVTEIVSESPRFGVPSSVTRTVMEWLPGPSASAGVQLNAPVEALIEAPTGAPASNENVSVWPASASVAVAVKLSVASSSTVLFPIGASTGLTFAAALTTIEIASKSLSGGVPLSVTRTVTGKVPLAEGVKLKTPVVAPIVAPAGAPAAREKASGFAGTAGSVAVA